MVFLFGIIKTLHDFFSKNKEAEKIKNPAVVSGDISHDKNQLLLTPLEITFNRLFAILLILTSMPLLLNMLTLLTIIIFTIFAIFLWFGKKYRLFANIIFLIFALGIYFIPIPPIAWGVFRTLKGLRLGGFDFLKIDSIFCIAPLIFVTFAVKNVLGNIFAYFKTSTVWRNVYFMTSLFIVFATLLAYPFLDNVRLSERAVEDDSGDNKLSFILTKQELKHDGGSTSLSRDYTARFDPVSNKYVYRLYLEDPLSESIAFTAVETDGEKINFLTDNRVKCLNCQKNTGDPFGLVFPASNDIDFIISSDQLIKAIKFTESGDKVAEFVFWK